MIAEITSPRIEDLGKAPDNIRSTLSCLASEVIKKPGFVEHGRLSRRVTLGEDPTSNEVLHKFAYNLGEAYLGSKPMPGSTALISVVTDSSRYAKHTRDSKAASNWHQDFVVTERGFFFPPEGATRLVVPTAKGPLCAVGQLSIVNALRLEEVESPDGLPDRDAALNIAPTVIGADGVLVKSEPDPLNGEIYQAEPDRVYVIPPKTVHKANPNLPDGRIFFQLDAIA